ncbi:hypothetical protein QBC46DRAFT_154984 [Diplogelasinospora grovesii]|uniref:SH3 domain-containing protein n=1 Tax=Diplogelasinospora grovesii TaxID=303347 RepID=A0AAN6N4J1_9PEZI|nr:hypothetical protein QBC46DRAFT_154984 [Diplogelasinospora grovesii]
MSLHDLHRARAHTHAHAHQRRNWWDQVQSAIDQTFNHGGSGNAVSTSTTQIVQVVTVTQDPSTQTVTASDSLITADAPATTSSSKIPTTIQQISATAIPTSLPDSYVPQSQSLDGTLAVASSSPTTTAQVTGIAGAAQQSGSSTATTSVSTVSPSASADSGDGGSAARAGIAIGVLAGIFVVGLLVWLLFNRRRKQMEKQRLEDDEKVNGPFADSADSIHTTCTSDRAPRLSLRPVTQFMPESLAATSSYPDRRASRGAALGATLSPQSAQLTRPAGASAWERTTATDAAAWDRPGTSASTHPANPFNDSHNIPEEPAQQRPVSPVESEVGIATTTDSPPRAVSPLADAHDAETTAAVAGAAATAAAAAGVAAGAVAAGGGLTRKTSIRDNNGPKALDLTTPSATTAPAAPLAPVPPSPAGTEFSMHSVAPGQAPGPSASAAAIAAAGGPAHSTVHRVQLDFRPTLEDEMELRAGQLVRLLHEYDDGWALCIRLDRSRQGVVPRTCLSTRPVKPRPAGAGGPGRMGPPVNPQQQQQQQQRGGYPPSGAYYPPANRPNNMMNPRGPPSPPRNGNGNGQYPRPESPATGRPMSPYGRPQSPAAAAVAATGRPMSPAGGGGRPQSPAQGGPRYYNYNQQQQQQGRSQSPNSNNGMPMNQNPRRMTPPSPLSSNPMNMEFPTPAAGGAGLGRKPVPGQAY